MEQETFSVLVASIATALVESIGTPSWPGMRDRMIGLLGRGAGGSRLAAEQLDEARARLEGAGARRRTETAVDLAARWANLLRRWAAEHPVVTAQLLQLQRDLGRGALTAASCSSLGRDASDGRGARVIRLPVPSSA